MKKKQPLKETFARIGGKLDEDVTQYKKFYDALDKAQQLAIALEPSEEYINKLDLGEKLKQIWNAYATGDPADDTYQKELFK
jgi:hypothetical protein